MEPTNPLHRESNESIDWPAELPFNGTIDQLIGYNLAELRDEANLSQDDIATVFERVTGREHSRNWLSRRETGIQPFTVAELIILAWIFKVPVVRLIRIDRLTGMVYVDGLMQPVRTWYQEFFIDKEESAADLVEWNIAEEVPERGKGLKNWVAHLRSTRESWLPWVANNNEELRNVFLTEHEPHKRAGKRYTAWQKKIDKRKNIIKEVVRAARAGQAAGPYNLKDPDEIRIERRRDGDDRKD
jgi:transcriptional regulator with XRE-family HTH domain